MNEIKLLDELRARRADPTRRIDADTVPVPPLYEPASATIVSETERILGAKFSSLLSAVYTTVGNGGFGPGMGLIGVEGGYPDSDGRFLSEKYMFLREQGWKKGLLPLWDWGDAAWSCVDALDPQARIVTVDESGCTLTRFTLSSWLESWLAGVDLHAEIFEIGDAIILNPFTRRPMAIKRRVKTKGTLL